MANHKSAIKRIRANAAKRLRNRYQAKTTRNAIKNFVILLMLLKQKYCCLELFLCLIVWLRKMLSTRKKHLTINLN